MNDTPKDLLSKEELDAIYGFENITTQKNFKKISKVIWLIVFFNSLRICFSLNADYSREFDPYASYLANTIQPAMVVFGTIFGLFSYMKSMHVKNVLVSLMLMVLFNTIMIFSLIIVYNLSVPIFVVVLLFDLLTIVALIFLYKNNNKIKMMSIGEKLW